MRFLCTPPSAIPSRLGYRMMRERCWQKLRLPAASLRRRLPGGTRTLTATCPPRTPPVCAADFGRMPPQFQSTTSCCLSGHFQQANLAPLPRQSGFASHVAQCQECQDNGPPIWGVTITHPVTMRYVVRIAAVASSQQPIAASACRRF